MKRFKSILLICDEDSVHDALIQRAIRLAKANDASITAVDVVDTAPGELAKMLGALPGARAREAEFEVLSFHRTRLAETAAPIRAEGVPVTEHVLQGIPFIEIIRQVLRGGHDLVMKGAGGTGKGRSLFFTSTDLHVMRKCPCPVWIMKRGASPNYERVLAAVDPEPNETGKTQLNTLILDLATSLSSIDESELHIVNAWKLDEENALRHSAFARVPKVQVDQFVEERRHLCEGKLNQLLSQYPSAQTPYQVHFTKGAAREVIPDLADTEQIDLIVMGTVGRTGVQGLIMGNTAEAILHQVECSVLAVKPPGFETPVRLEAPAAIVDQAKDEAA